MCIYLCIHTSMCVRQDYKAQSNVCKISKIYLYTYIYLYIHNNHYHNHQRITQYVYVTYHDH